MDRKQKIFGFDCLYEREGGRMLYLNNEDFSKISISWNETIGVIERALFCISKGDYSHIFDLKRMKIVLLQCRHMLVVT